MEAEEEGFTHQQRVLIAEMQLGDDAREFMRSPLGQFLWGCAKQEYEAARKDILDHLKKFRPFSRLGRKKLERLQAQAERAELFMVWVAEAMQRGEAAIVQLEEEGIV